MTPEQTQQVKALRAQGDHVQIFNYVIDHLRAQGERSVIRGIGRPPPAARIVDIKKMVVTHTRCVLWAL